jgi:hypothetical protein
MENLFFTFNFLVWSRPVYKFSIQSTPDQFKEQNQSQKVYCHLHRGMPGQFFLSVIAVKCFNQMEWPREITHLIVECTCTCTRRIWAFLPMTQRSAGLKVLGDEITD